MKWYFASRTRHQQKLATLCKKLEEKGEEIKSVWTYIDIQPPYTDTLERSQEVAAHIIQSILESEIFILVSDPAGTDMFTELGAALAKSASSPESIRIYIIGEHSKRSLIQLHPAVIHLPNLENVFEQEGFDYSDVDIPDLS